MIKVVLIRELSPFPFSIFSNVKKRRIKRYRKKRKEKYEGREARKF